MDNYFILKQNMQKIFGSLIVALLILMFACTKEIFITDSGARLSFSADTIKFDTVFSTIGTTTARLVIHNPYKQTIRISQIYLAKGQSSNYHININGYQTNQLTNVDLQPKDSLYIFVQLTVSTIGGNNPLVVKDSIVFITNNNLQHVELYAVGQDAHLLNNAHIKTQTWTEGKPYLIYNNVVIDTNQILTIAEGTKVYFHRKAKLTVYGSLRIDGSISKRVLLSGDRLEDLYKDVPGQWEGITFCQSSSNNYANNATIKNAITGINFDTQSFGAQTDLKLHNTAIENMTMWGIYAINSNIFATNCLITNCGQYSFAAQAGGQYNFYQTTFANYFGGWSSTTRITPSILLSNTFSSDFGVITNDLTVAYFGNCIVWGNQPDEIGVTKDAGAQLNFMFDNSLLQIQNPSNMNIDTTNHYQFYKCLYGSDQGKLFLNIDKNDFRLDTVSSMAKDKGSVLIVNKYPSLLYTDFSGQSRLLDGMPDLGAYELKKKSK